MKQNIGEFNSEERAAFILDLFHRTSIHHGIWFAEAIHQYGREQAYGLLGEVYRQSYGIQIKRLTKLFGGETSGQGLPEVLLGMEQQQSDQLIEALSVNWLANDGVWFQAIERSMGMSEAKRCNDSSWANFSPFEASAIRQFLQLGDQPGLEGLKAALRFRLYAFINKQSFTNETDDSFDFLMNDCRVQSARKRKGMDDYPCKSGGLIEYTSFARTIDSRITTECLCCPPDKHPDDYYCAWRFRLKN
jgi:hypothetical protein